MSDEFTRRNLLRAAAAAAAGSGVTGTVAGEGAGTDTDPQVTGRIPCREFDVVDLTTVSASEPLPDQATGIQPGSRMFIEYPDGTTAGCTANFIWRDTGGSGGSPGAPEDEGSDDEGSPDGEKGLSVAEDGGSDDAGPQSGNDDRCIGAAGHCFIDGNATADDRAGGDDERTYDVSQLDVTVCKDCNVGGFTGLAVATGEVYELGDVEYEFGSGTDATGVLTHLTTVGVAGTTITRCIEMPKDDDVPLDLEVVRANEDVTG